MPKKPTGSEVPGHVTDEAAEFAQRELHAAEAEDAAARAAAAPPPPDDDDDDEEEDAPLTADQKDKFKRAVTGIVLAISLVLARFLARRDLEIAQSLVDVVDEIAKEASEDFYEWLGRRMPRSLVLLGFVGRIIAKVLRNRPLRAPESAAGDAGKTGGQAEQKAAA